MMNLKKKFKLLIPCIFFVTAGYAQNSGPGTWFQYFGNQKINKKWNWHNEVQYRDYNFIGDINQLLLRTGIGYDLSENNNNILLGYAFIQSHTYVDSVNKITKNENRIFQQFITKEKLHTFYFLNRFRIEERFFANDYKTRFRYFLFVNKPLNKKAMEKNAVYLSAYDEIFLNFESPVYDQNRLYGGVGYCFNNNLRLETGFMAQMFKNRTQSQFVIMFFNNLPF
jgi:hypothetical protein